MDSDRFVSRRNLDIVWWLKSAQCSLHSHKPQDPTVSSSASNNPEARRKATLKALAVSHK